MISAKQLIKELKKGAKVSICYKTLSGTLGILEFSKVNGYLSMIDGMISHLDNGDPVINQTSEIISVDYAESLIFRLLFSTEVVNHSVSINYY